MLSTKSWGKKEEGHLEWWHLSSQVTLMHDRALLSQRWLKNCLLMGRSELISYFTLCVQLLIHLLNCRYISPLVFPVLPFQFSSPSHWGEASECCVGLSYLLALVLVCHTYISLWILCVAIALLPITKGSWEKIAEKKNNDEANYRNCLKPVSEWFPLQGTTEITSLISRVQLRVHCNRGL